MKLLVDIIVIYDLSHEKLMVETTFLISVSQSLVGKKKKKKTAHM